MASPHTSAAIAQTIFYVPAIPITLYILIRNWRKGPRRAWLPLFTFALVRLVGGALVIALASQPTNYGLNVAAIVLLNVGLIPLIVTTLALVQLVFQSSLGHKKWAGLVLKALEADKYIGAGLLLAGGSLVGNTANAVASRALGLAGYFNFTAILVVLIWLLAYLSLHRNEIPATDFVYVKWTLLFMPPLLLRAIYGLMYSFTASTMDTITTTWNPLFGSAVAFALMALLPEYLVLAVYTCLGFYRQRTPPEDGTKICSRESPDDAAQLPVHEK